MYNTIEATSRKYIKSPLNYIGGKQKILSQILPLFPTNINQFVDLFAGGCNVGVNVTANKVICNDNLVHLITMYKSFKENDLYTTIQHIQSRIEKFDLSLTNEEGYKKMREHYNKYKNPLDLFVLIAFSFNHQIRFNNSHEFNNPFGRDRSSFNGTMKANLERFIYKLKEKDLVFFCNNFDRFDFSILGENDFVYCDPPYLITTGTYNDGKRGFTGWNETEEKKLLNTLNQLNKRGVKFALSNVLEHKGKSNDFLKNWIDTNKDYRISYIDIDYSNSNYQTIIRDKNTSIEVLITNYEPKKPLKIQTLFEEPKLMYI